MKSNSIGFVSALLVSTSLLIVSPSTYSKESPAKPTAKAVSSAAANAAIAREVVFNAPISTSEAVRYKMDMSSGGQEMQMVISIAPSTVTDTDLTARYTFEKMDMRVPGRDDEKMSKMLKAVGDSFAGLSFDARSPLAGGDTGELLNRAELEQQLATIEEKLINAVREVGASDDERKLLGELAKTMFAPILQSMPEQMLKSMRANSNGVSTPLRGRYKLNQRQPLVITMPTSDGKTSLEARGTQVLSSISSSEYLLKNEAVMSEANFKKFMTAEFAKNPMTQSISVEGGSMKMQSSARIDPANAWPLEVDTKIDMKIRANVGKVVENLDQNIFFKMVRQ
jgi:hypothetical protein